MRGNITTSASRQWARAKGLSGKLPVYNFSTDMRPEYGQVAAAEINLRNVATVRRLQVALARIRLSTNGGKSHA